ncbi:hypothetical protein BC829DRAFT_403095, partial [Chytridium lagenaria]
GEILSTLRLLLRQVNAQYTSKNGSKIWHKSKVSDHSIIIRKHAEAGFLLTFLQSSREHKRLSDLYWPASLLSNEEKIKRTANVAAKIVEEWTQTSDERVAA